MYYSNLVTLLLVIIGGLNWLLVGLFQYDLVADLFGGQSGGLARLVYTLVGISAVWQLVPFSRMLTQEQARDGVSRGGRR